MSMVETVKVEERKRGREEEASGSCLTLSWMVTPLNTRRVSNPRDMSHFLLILRRLYNPYILLQPALHEMTILTVATTPQPNL